MATASHFKLPDGTVVDLSAAKAASLDYEKKASKNSGAIDTTGNNMPFSYSTFYKDAGAPTSNGGSVITENWNTDTNAYKSQIYQDCVNGDLYTRAKNGEDSFSKWSKILSSGDINISRPSDSVFIAKFSTLSLGIAIYSQDLPNNILSSDWGTASDGVYYKGLTISIPSSIGSINHARSVILTPWDTKGYGTWIEMYGRKSSTSMDIYIYSSYARNINVGDYYISTLLLFD